MSGNNRKKYKTSRAATLGKLEVPLTLSRSLEEDECAGLCRPWEGLWM